MPPFVFESAAATPEEPLPLIPVGQSTATPCPTCERHCGLTADRYWVKLNVVPLLSERWIGVMSRLGRLSAGLSFLIAGSFHFLILSRKMFARTVPFRRSRLP